MIVLLISDYIMKIVVSNRIYRLLILGNVFWLFRWLFIKLVLNLNLLYWYKKKKVLRLFVLTS